MTSVLEQLTTAREKLNEARWQRYAEFLRGELKLKDAELAATMDSLKISTVDARVHLTALSEAARLSPVAAEATELQAKAVAAEEVLAVAKRQYDDAVGKAAGAVSEAETSLANAIARAGQSQSAAQRLGELHRDFAFLFGSPPAMRGPSWATADLGHAEQLVFSAGPGEGDHRQRIAEKMVELWSAALVARGEAEATDGERQAALARARAMFDEQREAALANYRAAQRAGQDVSHEPAPPQATPPARTLQSLKMA